MYYVIKYNNSSNQKPILFELTILDMICILSLVFNLLVTISSIIFDYPILKYRWLAYRSKNKDIKLEIQ